MTNPLPDTVETRAGMIAACQWMNAQGLNQGTSGNISVRVQDGVLITPTAMPYEAMTPDDMVLLPHDGAPAADLPHRPSTEWPFHQRIHQTRPDMSVVLHAHPPHCTALSCQRRTIPACHYMVAAFGGTDVPLADYAVFGGEELSQAVAAALAERHGCLMANHGATVLGDTIPRAQWRLQELETLARTYLLSQIGGAPYILSDAEIDDVLERFAQYGVK